jgi:hypothetical protein
VGYDDPFCQQIADLGVHLVRYDNRDTGLSTHLDDVAVDAVAAVVASMSG